MDKDIFYMKKALQASRKARLCSPPNPWVGAAIVKNGKLISTGATHAPGGPHAEIDALQKAGENARGSVLYVTLEPCNHTGRTPPCTQAIIKAGITRVVIATRDPDPHVSGRGIEALVKHGIAVTESVLEADIQEELAPYLFQRLHEKSWVHAKAGMSLDGRLAAADGSSYWITDEKARDDAQGLRAASQAILVGASTAIHDLPQLTVRKKAKPRLYYRAFVDRLGRVPAKGPLFDPTFGPTIAITTPKCSQETLKIWEKCGVETAILPTCSPQEIVRFFSEKGVLQILLEGGGALLGAFLQENCINRLSLYVGPRILGSRGLPLFNGFEVPNIKDAPILELTNVRKIGKSVRIDYVF